MIPTLQSKRPGSQTVGQRGSKGPFASPAQTRDAMTDSNNTEGTNAKPAVQLVESTGATTDAITQEDTGLEQKQGSSQ